jgi:predicted nicotinamide N-methyase
MHALNLVEETVDVDGLSLSVLRPREAEALLSEEAFEHEEFLPYWAELWPSGVALTRVLRGRPLDGLRVLELGCGLGLPSIAAALGGARVLATDWSPEALEVTAVNAARNGAELETALVSWADPGPLVRRAPWELVLCADVLYERRNVDQLLELLPRLGGEVLIAEPGRPPAARFFEDVALEVEALEDRIYRLTSRAP